LFLECRAGEEEFGLGHASAVAGNAAARRARIARQVDERLAHDLTWDLRGRLDKVLKELEFVEDTLSSKRALLNQPWMPQ